MPAGNRTCEIDHLKGVYIAMTDEDSIAAIAATPGAFGTTTLAMLASELPVISA